MLQVHLRGLLKPEHRNGLLSQLREEVVSLALSMEGKAESNLNEMTLLVTAAASHYDPNKMGEKVKAIKEDLDGINRLRSFKLRSEKKADSVGGMDHMIAMYNLLQSKGVLEQFKTDEKLEEMERRHQEEAEEE